jgi:hypothetical protein
MQVGIETENRHDLSVDRKCPLISMKLVGDGLHNFRLFKELRMLLNVGGLDRGVC